jgi:hypothetical protein
MDVQFATPEADDPFVGADVERVELFPKLRQANIDVVRYRKSGATKKETKQIANGDRYDAMIAAVGNDAPFANLVRWMVGDGMLPPLAPPPIAVPIATPADAIE